MKHLFHTRRSPPAAAPLAERYPEFDIGIGSYGRIKIHQYGEKTTLTIGNYCSLADDVEIMLGGGHRADWVTTFPFSALDKQHRHIIGHPVSKGDVVIGHDVWIGRQALILPGVTIGSGALALSTRALSVMPELRQRDTDDALDNQTLARSSPRCARGVG